MTHILQDIRVLDVTRYVAGPMCTALLSDLGADVIRIEPPGGGDDRTALPLGDFHGGAGFTQVCRNKRGLTLDLASAAGRSVFDRLLVDADLVVANLPPKSVRSLGLDYERLCSIKPDIIFVHMTAFGTEGQYADRLGFDGIAQIMSGLTHLSGDPGRPMKSAAAWADMATGFIGAFGAVAALRHRDRTGQGQVVSANLLQTAMTIGNYFLIEQAVLGLDRAGTGNRAPSGAPADLVSTSDGEIFIAVLGDPMFARFARMVGRADELLGDPRFGSDGSRAEHGEALSAVAAEWAKQITTAEALAMLARHKLPSGPLLTPRQVLDDPTIRDAFIQPVAVDGLPGPIPYVRPPATFSKTPGRIEKGPPQFGADNDAILAEAGYSREEIQQLRREGVI